MDLPDNSFDLGGYSSDSGGFETFTATKVDLNNNRPEIFECDICKFTTYRKYNLDRHMKRVHKNQLGQPKNSSTPSDKTKKSRVCDQCGKGFATLFGLTLHTKDKHSKIYKHECTVCGKGFNQSVQFKHHRATHLDLAMLKCGQCGMSIKGHSSLRRHQLIACDKTQDQTKKSFSCDECYKEFASKERLKSHQKGMHGPERYMCVHCGNKFRWRSSLKVHMKNCR